MSITKTVTQPFVKIYNFIQREFAYTAQIDQSGGFLPYSVDENSDSFPIKLNNLVKGSPTATACISTITDFITGEGFNQGPELENKIINDQGLTFARFHSISSDSFSHNWGVASLVMYNRVGAITQIYDIPFGYCRLGKPDDKGVISKIHYNPYFGTSLYKKGDTIIYDIYNPEQAVVQMTKKPKEWKGQINWLGIRDNKHPFYPVPDYYSAKSWMRIEYNAGVYFDENLENGFLNPTIIKLLGNPNDASGQLDSNDKELTKGAVFNDMMTKDFSGAGRVGKMMAFWGDNKDEWPTLEAFPTNGGAEVHRLTDEQATRKITIATKVPAILSNVNDANNFGGEQIRPAVKLMQQRVKRPQNILIDYYTDMLKRFVTPVKEPIAIVPYNPFPEQETVDPLVWAVMTEEEQRKWVTDHTEIELIEETPETAPAPVAPVQNRIVNLHFNSYPQKAKENVKKALEWQEKFGATCLKPKGKELSEMILAGTPLGPKEIKRLSRFLSKQTVYASHPYDNSCESVEYDAWGGSEMMIWANEKVKELNGQAD